MAQSLSVLSGNTTSITALSNVALVIPNIVGLFNSGSNPQNTIGYQPQSSSSTLGVTLASQPALLFLALPRLSTLSKSVSENS